MYSKTEGVEPMPQGLRIVLSNAAGVPIYEQIKGQIKTAILSGDVADGEQLPSIRGLARDLRVSVITTTRAYGDLAAEGFVANVQGKGSFVLPRDSALVREHVLRDVEEHLDAAVAAAALADLGADQLHTMLDLALAPEPLAGRGATGGVGSTTTKENSDA